MEYIYLKETDQKYKDLIERLSSPLIVAEQYLDKFPNYAIRAEQLKQELITFIYTFNSI